MQFSKCFRYLRHILFGIRNFRLLSFCSHNVRILQPEQADARSPRRRLIRKFKMFYDRKCGSVICISSITRPIFRKLNPPYQLLMWEEIGTPGENPPLFGRALTYSEN
jgi:hypothetical protein